MSPEFKHLEREELIEYWPSGATFSKGPCFINGEYYKPKPVNPEDNKAEFITIPSYSKAKQ